MRFGEIRTAVDGISAKVLTDRTAAHPVRTLRSLGHWAKEDINEVLAARDAYDTDRSRPGGPAAGTAD
ncbi:hypothetical protein F5983_24720 [Streptomyces arboris]|uniref:Uncharacterized protein n=1 Tax=Streptomyces arboris TaxID=2600619 RepID=A0A5N5EVE9_9ACTN|nr:hypothetical protein F5983_24720 [Streptomyces arboris]